VRKKKDEVTSKLRRFIEERLVLEPEKIARLGVWAAGTVVCHNLNIGGIINWFGQATDTVPTGWPPPFHRRRRFPWEAEPEQTWEDKICEWAIPAVTSWILVYHPEAMAQFIDAMIPF